MRFPGIQYDSPVAFTRKQRFLLRVLPPLAAAVLKLLRATFRLKVAGRDEFRQLAARGPVLLALWHESMLFGVFTFPYTNFHGLTSYSFDGEMASRVLTFFGLDAVRGSSSRGGGDALVNLEKALPLAGVVGITLDGPKGPRRQAKPGIAILSGRTGVPVVPFAFAVDRCIRMRSWDRFPLPLPFARVLGALGEPISPPPDDSPEAVEEMRVKVETALNALQTALEDQLGCDIMMDQTR